MNKAIYKGISFRNYDIDKSIVLTDVELVKRDLLNHIFTRRGERVKMPTFGTRIPELVFEPLDDTTIEIIYEDLENVFTYDPRVEIIELSVIPFHDENAVIATASLNYIELNLIDVLDIRIEFEG